jgi:predicted oxidoreductase
MPGLTDVQVIATKFTTNFRANNDYKHHKILSNYNGNSTKSLHVSVEASLKKLKTDYIDLVGNLLNSCLHRGNSKLTGMPSSTFTGGTTRHRSPS